MASLLSKFRINYESLKMVSGITETPQPETVKLFNSLVEGFSEENVVDPGKRNMGTGSITRPTVVSLTSTKVDERTQHYVAHE